MIEANGISANFWTINNSYERSMWDIQPKNCAAGIQTKPSAPVRKTASMVTGINGRTRMLAKTPMIESCPIMYKMNGETNICVEIVAEHIPRISYFSGMNQRSFSIGDASKIKPSVARKESWNDGSWIRMSGFSMSMRSPANTKLN